MVKSADVSEVKQKVDEDIGEEINVSPKHVRFFGTSNIFTRAFAYLFGWTREDKPIKLRATGAGVLKVATEGTGLEETEKKTGLATYTESGAISFSRPISYLLIYALDHDLLFRPSPYGVSYQDQIRIFGGNVLSIGLVVKSFKVKKGGDFDTHYEVVGLR